MRLSTIILIFFRKLKSNKKSSSPIRPIGYKAIDNNIDSSLYSLY
jgi:hypothetical protein